jgi:hypothetical protein
MHERALKTREPSYVPRVAKHFFIPVVHSLLRAMGHVAAPELPSQEGRAPSHGTRGSTEAHLSKEARSGAEGHVVAPELISARRRGLGPRDTWQCRISPQHGGEVRGTRGGARANLYMEVWSEAAAYVAARGCTPCSLS